MKKLLIKISFFLVFLISPINAESDEFFCLDKDGFIYPLFEETNCDEAPDKKINKDEFSFIIDFKGNLRISKLQDYRKNLKEAQKKNDTELSKNLEKKKKQDSVNIAKLAQEQKHRGTFKLQKAKKLKEIKAIKEEQERKKIAKQKENELRKAKRLEEIKARKEEQERKKIAKQKENYIQLQHGAAVVIVF